MLMEPKLASDFPSCSEAHTATQEPKKRSMRNVGSLFIGAPCVFIRFERHFRVGRDVVTVFLSMVIALCCFSFVWGLAAGREPGL